MESNIACPCGRRSIRAAAREDRHDCECSKDPEEQGDKDRHDLGNDIIESPQKDDHASEEEDHAELEEDRDRREHHGDLPVLPRLDSDLADKDVLSRQRERRVPLDVLADPLLSENAEERSSEAEYEAEEEEDVDRAGSGGGGEGSGDSVGERRQRLVEGVADGRANGVQLGGHAEGEELVRCVCSVDLEHRVCLDEEGGQDGRE